MKISGPVAGAFHTYHRRHKWMCTCMGSCTNACIKASAGLSCHGSCSSSKTGKTGTRPPARQAVQFRRAVRAAKWELQPLTEGARLAARCHAQCTREHYLIGTMPPQTVDIRAG